MSFAAEPYGVFVDDLLSSLTGGVVREQFVFLPESAPFRLPAGADVLPATVRVHGLVDGAFARFRPGTDFDVAPDGELVWREGPGAVRPEPGSRFYAGFEVRPDAQAPPRLTDRSVGSVVRLLAESMAREHAVLSRQLELVYRSAFVDTAEGRDLDAVAALVGVERRTRLSASGEVVLSRATPAPADVAVPAGLQVSSASPPAVTAETTEAATLRAGTLSVAVPVRAVVDGPEGVAPAGTLTVVRRPVLGIDAVTNPQPLRLGGADETDEALRRRVRRALEGSGAGTVGALTAALTSVEGIREQDVLIGEDHVRRPGVLSVVVAADLDEAAARSALTALEAARPAGVRLVHDLPVPPDAGLPPSAPPTAAASADPAGLGAAAEGRWFDVAADVVVLPAGPSLPADRQRALAAAVTARVRDVVADLGVGAPVVHARVVAGVMGVEGVADVLVRLFPARVVPEANVHPPQDRRARLRDENLRVTLRGALVALDVRVEAEPLGLAALVPDDVFRGETRRDVGRRLAEALRSAATVDRSVLLGALSDTATYRVLPDTLEVLVDFLQEGLVVRRRGAEVVLTPDQLAWVRSVTVPPRTPAGSAP